MEKKKKNEKFKNKSKKGLFAIAIVVVMMFSLIPLGATATNTINEDTTDSSDFKITTKAKAATVKVTWNANEGKIGTKKTTTTSVKKGKKIGKLPKTPKLAGYTFKGWYTKKTGGTKITKNTKVKKKVTYYAQWTKGVSNSSGNKRVLTSVEEKLVGDWIVGSATGSFFDSSGNYQGPSGGGSIYSFKSDGTFSYGAVIAFASPSLVMFKEGFWRVSGDKIYLSSQKGQQSSDGGKTWKLWAIDSNADIKYIMGTDVAGNFIQMEVSSGTFSDKFRRP